MGPSRQTRGANSRSFSRGRFTDIRLDRSLSLPRIYIQGTKPRRPLPRLSKGWLPTTCTGTAESRRSIKLGPHKRSSRTLTTLIHSMALFDTLRLVSFATVLAFSLIVLGISGYWVSLLEGVATSLATSSSFSLAVSVITWAFMFPVLLVSTLRRGSFLSWVAMELGICGFLWVLWLASAAYTTSMSAGITLNCDLALTAAVESVCRQYQAIQAFSWLNWLILFAYLVLVIIFAVKAMNKGQSVWTMEIADLSAAVSGSGADGSTIAASNHASKAPEPSHYQQSQFNQPMQQYPQGVAQA
ncbi:hypothetical protein OPQ81_004242 [Rhizoctonia solani]|nr:hypothetical protein OPQ81_004242 [Rhizoctonia solani]